MLHDQGVADFVELIGVITALVGGFEAFAQFPVENKETKAKNRFQVLPSGGGSHSVGSAAPP